MSSNQQIAAPEPLSLPHFDEEATLLSARPVVPLHEVKAEKRSKRRLIFASTILAAVLVGGIGASLLFIPGGKQTSLAEGEQGNPVNPGSDSSQHNESGSFNDTAGQSPASEVIESGESAPLNALTKEQIGQTATSTSSKASVNREESPRTSSAGRPTRANSAPRTSDLTTLDAQSDEDLEMDERRLRREERREARRLRRERRNRREQSSDDLMRIREIFEGTPRP